MEFGVGFTQDPGHGTQWDCDEMLPRHEIHDEEGASKDRRVGTGEVRPGNGDAVLGQDRLYLTLTEGALRTLGPSVES